MSITDLSRDSVPQSSESSRFLSVDNIHIFVKITLEN